MQKKNSRFGNRLRELRLESGYSQSELAQLIGISKSSINMYERGEREPGFETMEALADTFNVDMNYLMGLSDEKGRLFDGSLQSHAIPSNILPLPKTYKVPLLGTIACGEPILAQENIDGYVDVPYEIRCDFTLRCTGDSMIDARIYDGDLVYIREQPQVENGEIAAVLVDSAETEATLKRVYQEDEKVTLMPANPVYAPMVYVGEDINKLRILGRAVAFTSMVR